MTARFASQGVGLGCWSESWRFAESAQGFTSKDRWGLHGVGLIFHGNFAGELLRRFEV
jgi:hypothetical protein